MSCPLNLCWIVSALIYLGNPKHEQQEMVCSVPTEQKNNLQREYQKLINLKLQDLKFQFLP